MSSFFPGNQLNKNDRVLNAPQAVPEVFETPQQSFMQNFNYPLWFQQCNSYGYYNQYQYQYFPGTVFPLSLNMGVYPIEQGYDFIGYTPEMFKAPDNCDKKSDYFNVNIDHKYYKRKYLN